MSQDIPLWYACLIVFVAGCGIAGVMGERHNLTIDRWLQARSDACAETARARAAERPHRQRLHPGHRPMDPALIPRAALPADDMDQWLAEWHLQVEEAGLPFLTCTRLGLEHADVVFDPDSYLPKIVAPITTGRMRRIAGLAA